MASEKRKSMGATDQATGWASRGAGKKVRGRSKENVARESKQKW